MKITLNYKNNKAWYAYTLKQSGTSDILYVGEDRMTDIINFRSVLKHPDFNFDASYDIEFISSACEKQSEAKNIASAYNNNMNGGRLTPLNTIDHARTSNAIICHNTGQIFQTQLEAARVLDINQSQLSKHLQRAPGYRHIKGMTFEYITGVVKPPHEIPVPNDSVRVAMATQQKLPDGWTRLSLLQKSWYTHLESREVDKMSKDEVEMWDDIQKTLTQPAPQAAPYAAPIPAPAVTSVAQAYPASPVAALIAQPAPQAAPLPPLRLPKVEVPVLPGYHLLSDEYKMYYAPIYQIPEEWRSDEQKQIMAEILAIAG